MHFQQINNQTMKIHQILLFSLIIPFGIISAQNPQNKKNVNVTLGKNALLFPTVTLKDCSLEVKKDDENGSYKWDQAIAICESYGQGWRLPDKPELKCLYENKEKIEGFKRDWYWSSQKVGEWNSFAQSFSNGKQFGYSRANTAKVRCVRSLK
jgi:hypothetical protein